MSIIAALDMVVDAQNMLGVVGGREARLGFGFERDLKKIS